MVDPVLDVHVEQAFEVVDPVAVFLGAGAARRVAAAGHGEADLGVRGVGDAEQQQFEQEVGADEDPAQERQQGDEREAGRGRCGVQGRHRRTEVRRDAEEERDGGRGGQGGEEDDVVAHRVDEGHVRQQHRDRQCHHQDDGDGPHQPVAGASSGPADDGEQHPQELVLPGGRTDRYGGAAGDGDREQVLAVVGVADRAAQGDGRDGGAERQEEADLQGPSTPRRSRAPCRDWLVRSSAGPPRPVPARWWTQ
ncbi:hypothetical protein SHKM778_74750 [Streptomyces sp. KM77-8]|uniref:Uncharacterized protein n=1 Tax=Streptomyces haneummycinicus TaxID=3074435 RepID=A0AAT9HUS5_9ACTN